MKYIVIIVAFIVGALISSWLSSRGASRRKAGEAGPPRRPSQMRLPPVMGAWLRYFPVTSAFIAICVVIAVISGLGTSDAVVGPLLISDPKDIGFDAILSGEVWRLITPIFLHFGVAHIAFNMFALWQLGRLVEHVKGGKFMLGFTVAVGIASNVAQFVLTGSPFFGGMSGVLYGFFGYIWMQGKYNPRFGFTVPQQTVAIMLIWFAMCWAGLLGPIANWAHTTGLIMGAGWGYLKRGSPR